MYKVNKITVYCKSFKVEKFCGCRTELQWAVKYLQSDDIALHGQNLLTGYFFGGYLSICENRKTFPPLMICNILYQLTTYKSCRDHIIHWVGSDRSITASVTTRIYPASGISSQVYQFQVRINIIIILYIQYLFIQNLAI